MPTLDTAPVATPGTTSKKIVDLAARRRGRLSMLSRSAAAVAAMLMLAGSPMVIDDLLQADFGLHLSRLGACNIEAITTDRECAVLAWLSL